MPYHFDTIKRDANCKIANPIIPIAGVSLYILKNLDQIQETSPRSIREFDLARFMLITEWKMNLECVETEKMGRGGGKMIAMNAGNSATRETILKEIHDLMRTWPQTEDQEHFLRTEAAVQELELLAKNTDETCTDRLERARSWRQVGNAYVELSLNAGPEMLDSAISAYKRAEMCLAGIQHPVERMLLSFSYGNALFNRSRRNDLWIVQEARDRYAKAHEIAKNEMPAAVAEIESALETAERVIEILHKRQDLFRRIAAFKQQSPFPPLQESGKQQAPAESHLFEMLIANYSATAQIPFEPRSISAEWLREQ
jgi:hypothetical protein